MAVLGRLRRARKAPLAVAAILATPLFFAALMAFSLELEKPTVAMLGGKQVLGDPTGSTEASIWLTALAPAVVLLLLGAAASLLPTRLAAAVPSVAAIGIVIALRLPLDTWEARHTGRYAQGIDLIPQSDPGDLSLRGEWEENAHRTAEQLGFWTIAIAVAAILISIAVEIRRRRGIVGPPVPPPPEVATGEAGMVRRGLSFPSGRPRG